MSGDGNHSSAGPSIILLIVVILPVAYDSRPVPQFLMIFPVAATTVEEETSTEPG